MGRRGSGMTSLRLSRRHRDWPTCEQPMAGGEQCGLPAQYRCTFLCDNPECDNATDLALLCGECADWNVAQGNRIVRRAL